MVVKHSILDVVWVPNRGWQFLPPCPGCALADRVLLAFITDLGLPQLSPRTPGPSPQSRTLHRVSLSQILFVLVEFHEVLVIPFLQSESLWVAALPLTILALPLICCHPQTWWKGTVPPPPGIPTDIKQVRSQDRSLQYSTSYWPPERVQPFNCWPLSPIIQFSTHVVVHLSSPQCVYLETRQ